MAYRGKTTILALAWVLLWYEPSYAISAKSWVNHLIKKSKPLRPGEVPSNILFVSSLKSSENPLFVKDFPYVNFSNLGFLTAIDENSYLWNKKLNFDPTSSAEKEEGEEEETARKAISVFAEELKSNVVVHTSQGDKWSIYLQMNRRFAKLGSVKKPGRLEAHEVYMWLIRVLGYHGFVVDIRKDKILFTTNRKNFTVTNTKTLILDKSHKKLFLRSKERKGIALCETIDYWQSFGVCKIKLKKPNAELFPGQKLIIEKEG